MPSLHSPAKRVPGGRRRRLLVALVISIIIAAVEIVGGLRAGSLALLGDAGHMLADILAIVLSLVAIQLANRPATPEKTYGFWRLEILAALFNGVALSVVAVILFFEAIKRLQNPPEVQGPLMLVVATVGLVGNLLAAWVLHGSRHNLGVRGAYLHILGDTLSSLAVVAGGVAITMTDRARFLDPLLTMLIATIILFNALRLVRDTTDVLLEATPKGLELEEVRGAILDVEGVVDTHDLHIWSLTTGFEALSAHVIIRGTELTDSDRVLRAVHKMLGERFEIHHTTLQIESQAYGRGSTA